MGGTLQGFFSAHQNFVSVALFALGSIIGSFLNVCIYRIPRGETVVTTPSHCPACGKQISWYDNIPLLSYLFLRGRCRVCHGHISLRYPLVEGMTGGLYLLIYLRFGPTLETVAYSLLASLLIVSSFTDLERDEEGGLFMMIPDLVTVPGTVAGVLLSMALSGLTLMESLLGLVAGGGALYLVMRIAPLFMSRGGGRREAMGEGDTKLAAMMGAFLGWEKVLVAVYLGIILGAVVGVILLALKIKGRKDAVPFGPFLAAGAMLSLFFGRSFISWFFTFR